MRATGREWKVVGVGTLSLNPVHTDEASLRASETDERHDELAAIEYGLTLAGLVGLEPAPT
jgi:hypothetical protein